MSVYRRLLSVMLAVSLMPNLVNAEQAGEGQTACWFTLGFKSLRDQIPHVVGDCLESEWHNPENGDGLQRSTRGLLVWRKADNWTAFTDGHVTWINGPLGLARRLNSGPLFAWEAAPLERRPTSAAANVEAPVLAGTLTHGPLLGAITDRGVKVWARADGPGRLQLQVKPSNQNWPSQMAAEAQFGGERDFSAVLEAANLVPASGYDYRLMLNGVVQGDFGGSFRTLPEVGKPGVFRFALGADLSAAYAPFTILDRVLEQRPDFNLLVGDLIYADQPDPIPPAAEAYAAKYRASWSDPSFRRLTRGVPSFMIWDDHDIENDYDGGKTDRYLAARAALETYVTSHNPAPLRGEELYFTFRVVDVEFFVLDTRSFRSPRALPDDGAKTMLGAEQKLALKNWLSGSRAPFKVVVSSVPVHDFGQSRPDSWSSYVGERTELLDFIRQRRISGVVVLSGDQHWSSLVRNEFFGIWEFNATPLAQAVHEPPIKNDPQLVLSYNSSPAFGVIDVDTRGSSPKMTFTVVDADGQVRHTTTINPATPR